MIATCIKWHFDIWPFLWFLEDKIVNLGQIDFLLGVYLNINVMRVKTNFKSISKKIWPK